ncbi:phytoene desaturase [Bacillus coahuilensis p1.1.43]|uniref:4,4'-diaponeurosporene oxygenase n=1 Tax=Bacillus coahuilensis p1.1.43 TaxID=1150625 RepID=A0A147K8F9_9BACI|nr:phytoene desaturase family protein [Bacillus coahuilensis]KUP06464.1 phytoene desaturase [Bacillus coahuilensis p1.1.43]
MKTVVIVGAGLGGLAAGILLQSKGFQVTIIEKNQHAGGKMREYKEQGYSFDFGPNTITMPHVFTNVINEAGFNAQDYLQFIRLENHTMNEWEDGTRLLQSSNQKKMIEELKKIDSYGAKQYPSYLKAVEKLYKDANTQFFYRTFQSFRDYLSPSLSKAFMKVKPFRRMNDFHEKYFKDPHVLMVFNRYATYIGSSPYKSPATFSLIGHLEMNDGVFYTKGGNTQIAQSFLKVFKELGGCIKFNTVVKKMMVKDKRVLGVQTDKGEVIYGDEVIINGDFITSTKHLLNESERPSYKDSKLDQYDPSISAFVILAGVREFNPNVHHHHVYFTSDYKKEFYQLFEENTLPDDPTIYISHSAKTDRERTKGSNFFILVNSPATHISEEEKLLYKEKVYDKLERMGVSIRPYLEYEKVITASSIQKDYFAYKGSLYGISSHRMKDSFLRPYNRNQDIDNIYYVGGTTHPGGGSPMVTISGVNVAKEIIKKYKL